MFIYKKKQLVQSCEKSLFDDFKKIDRIVGGICGVSGGDEKNGW